MRLLLLCLTFPTAALAWEFTPNPVCTLSHQSDEAALVITYDSAGPLYQLDLTLTGENWADSPTFGMAFAGGQELSIGTGRHVIAGDTLTVTDSGFGNVLNGLEFNSRVLSFTADRGVEFSLEGAPPEVRKFRDCMVDPSLSS
ncbi:MAG: hypothetical protein AAF401_07580 [Pseudomonadota bacterium]